MYYGVEAIQKLKTRTVTAEIDVEGEDTKATFEMRRLPVDLLIEYMSLFEGVSDNDPSKLFTKQKLGKIVDLMSISIHSANEEVPMPDVREFVASNFFLIFPFFVKVNGGDIKVKESQVPTGIKEMLDKHE